MNERSGWQESAIALCESASTRLSGDARKLQDILSQLGSVPASYALTAGAHWLSPFTKLAGRAKVPQR